VKPGNLCPYFQNLIRDAPSKAFGVAHQGSGEIIYYNPSPLVRFRSLLGLAQRSLPFFAGVVLGTLLCKDSVGNLEVTMCWAMDGGIASTWKLLG